MADLTFLTMVLGQETLSLSLTHGLPVSRLLSWCEPGHMSMFPRDLTRPSEERERRRGGLQAVDDGSGPAETGSNHLAPDGGGAAPPPQADGKKHQGGVAEEKEVPLVQSQEHGLKGSTNSSKEDLNILLRQLATDETILGHESTTDRLLALGWRCYDEGSSSDDNVVPLADRVSRVFGRLLEAVTEAVLSGSYCSLHHARLKAVQDSVTFFCRVKSPNSISASAPVHRSSPSIDSSDNASSDLPPPVIMDELRRRLQTYLLSLQWPAAHDKVDALRKRDIIQSIINLHSPLLPLDITLRSLVLPLLEYVCCDMTMSSRLGVEARARLKEDLQRMKEMEEEQSDLFQTVGTFWKLATGGEEAAAKAGGLADRLCEPIGALIRWIRGNVGILRMGNSLEELLGSVEPGLRTSLREQEYESADHFLKVFKGYNRWMSEIRVPPSCTTCGRLIDTHTALAADEGKETVARRECMLFDLTLAQVLKDVSRDRFVIQGSPLSPVAHVQASLTALFKDLVGTDVMVAKAVRWTLTAASRTVFGGDTFFLVRELFGGEGVVVAPAAVGKHQPQQDPIEIRVERKEDKCGDVTLSVVVRSSNLFSIYSGLDLSRQGTATAIVNLSATVTEVLPLEVAEVSGRGLTLREALSGRVRTISIDAQLPPS